MEQVIVIDIYGVTQVDTKQSFPYSIDTCSCIQEVNLIDRPLSYFTDIIENISTL